MTAKEIAQATRGRLNRSYQVDELEERIRDYADQEIQSLLNDIKRSRSFARKWDTNKSEVEGFGRAMDVVEDIFKTRLDQKPE